MVNKIIEEEFLKYFKSPMRLVGIDEETSGINIKEYFIEILQLEELNITLDKVEIPYVYMDADRNYEHILLSYGIEDLFIAIITDTEKILGYHILDLKEKYGIEKPSKSA